ncbi:uncharacterized protein CG5098-like isoform X2 [Euwallacea fornicatus]|uniref:uncharacterized protein CG5098-like isoform X2 n=1 Tax=Euwallacea fornicatus TaxID=995702 RepID=UPI00338DB079
MSGSGPPHHPHSRHVPPSNSAWNHLQVPGFFPRQPQVAHMPSEHPLLHQPTWHTPTTTDAMKMIPHTQMLNEMFKNEALFPRDCVDLSLTRGVKPSFMSNQNGDHASTPAAISLSVRDATKINSLPPGMLEIQAVELTKCTSPSLKSAISPGSIRASSMSPGLKSVSPCLKSASPGLKSASPGLKSASPGLKSASPGLLSSGPTAKSLSPSRKSLSPGPVGSPGLNLGVGLVGVTLDVSKNQKRSNVRVDSILERLNPAPEKTFPFHDNKHDLPSTVVSAATSLPEKSQTDKPQLQSQSVIVQPAGNFDENSNSSGTTNAPTPKEEDSASMHSNEDSLDSTKSRRKRKPSKTVRVNKEDEFRPDDIKSSDEVNHKGETSNEVSMQADPALIATILEGTSSKSGVEASVDELDSPPRKTRRKSEAETIDDIAAMVQESLKGKGEKKDGAKTEMIECEDTKENIEITSEGGCGGEDFELESGDNTETVQDLTEQRDLDIMLPLAGKMEEMGSENVTELQSVQMDTICGQGGKRIDTSESKPSANQAASSVAKPVTVSVIKTKDKLQNTMPNGSETFSEPSSGTTPVSLSVTPVATPAQKKATITQFVEVENKLEEMFAGIVEDHVEPIAPRNIDSEQAKIDSNLGLTDDNFGKLEEAVDSMVSADNKQEIISIKDDIKNEVKVFTTKKGASRRSRPSSKSDQDGEVPVKKKKLTKTKNSSSNMKKLPRSPPGVKSPKKSVLPVTSSKSSAKVIVSDAVKDIYSYDSGSNASSSRSRGPFVQIRGPRDSPLSVSVINTPLGGDEDGEKKSFKNKKFHDDSEYRHKVRSKGLHCSTLSNKYDAERKDASWICAFCKRGPHANELTGPSVINEVPPPGDLFGPYIITTNCPEFEKRLDDPYDRQFKSRKIGKALDAANAASTSGKSSKKTKRKSETLVDPGDIYLGITDTGNNAFEVWSHEDCIVWSPGVYLVGPKIAGLEEAVWTCSNVPCSGCGLKGANVTCVKRGCLSASHVSCARKFKWVLDAASFKAHCPEHVLR